MLDRCFGAWLTSRFAICDQMAVNFVHHWDRPILLARSPAWLALLQQSQQVKIDKRSLG